MVGNGVFCALCGCSEHRKLQTHHIVTGVYPKGHPFEGLKWAGLDLAQRKNMKLSPSNVYFEDLSTSNRQPVWDDSPKSSCWAGSLIRYKEKLGPSQTDFYCYPASQSMVIMFKKQGYPKARYSPNENVGENSLRAKMKEAAKILGFKHWEHMTGHMLRRHSICEMVNAPKVNLKESMGTAGHKSVSAHLAYIVNNLGFYAFYYFSFFPEIRKNKYSESDKLLFR